MIKELQKQEAIYLWNNHYQGTFKPTDFDELLQSNDIIKNDIWKQEITEIKNRINTDLFQSFLEKYRGHKISNFVENLETFVKEGKQYLKLNLCINPEYSEFMACFLLDLDYTVQYLCIDSKIEIKSLPFPELNLIYKKYHQLIPPPLEFIEEFNKMNAQLTELTGENVERAVYQAWFKLVPNIKIDSTFAKAYHAYQSVGNSLFGDTQEESKGGEFEYTSHV